MTTKTYRHYLFGIILSIALACWLAALGIIAVANPTLGWGIMGLVVAAIWVGGPLAALLIITWIAYLVRDRGQVSGRVHALLFVPTLLALMIYPAYDAFDQARRDGFSAAHPPVSETHVNLSGRDLWIDTSPYASTWSGGGPDMPMKANEAERFAAFTRYPNNPNNAAASTAPPFPYEGSRLRAGLSQYGYAAPADRAQLAPADATQAGAAELAQTTRPPAARANAAPLTILPYPNLKPLTSTLGHAEASLLRYVYFHYPDHVDVAPVLGRMSGMSEQRYEEKALKGLVLFTAYNYAPGAIARLELNGQTLDIGERALPSTAPLPALCPDFARPLGNALIDIDQAVTVRWQTLDAPQTWHEAPLRVPAFKKPAPVEGESTLMQVQLNFLPDGTVQAERFVRVQLPKGQLGIRTTGLPAEAAAYASCGSAFSAFNPQTVQRLE